MYFCHPYHPEFAPCPLVSSPCRFSEAQGALQPGAPELGRPRILGLGFTISGFGLGFRVSDLGFRVWGFGLIVEGQPRVQASGFGV